MESTELELPECPVCLQTYSGDYTIPRVLACGHTTCESCLKNLPQKYPHTIRCPACTQLVKFPSQGPSYLPKNIDLLRLNPNPNPKLQKPQNGVVCGQQFDPVSRLWSDEFYSTWKNWVLDKDGVLLQSGAGRYGVLKGSNKKVRLFKLFDAADVLFRNERDGNVFELNYVARVMNFLYKFEEGVMDELGFVLGICSKCCRVCKAYGLWLDLKDGVCYLVCEKLNGTVLDWLPEFEKGLGKELLSSFYMMGMEMCESVIALHLENLFLGCLSVSCFELDDFGHANITLGRILLVGSSVNEVVMEAGSDGRGISENEMGTLVSELFKKEIFISPECLFQMLKKEGFVVDYGRSDVWSLASVLLRILIGNQFINHLVDYVVGFILNSAKENCSELYRGLVENVRSSLGCKLCDEYEPLKQILCKCLNLDPKNRPLVIDLWKCIRGLIFGLQFDALVRLDDSTHEKTEGHCVVLGQSPLTLNRTLNMNNKYGVQRAQNGIGENVIQSDKIEVNKDFTEGLLDGNVKLKDMKGHLDCVTGLAIGGGFLFSSSFDRSVYVWSLEDFSHLHTFKGHEHKVTAVIYVDEGEPLCISCDSGGGIFLWSLTMPLRQEPLKKWFEEKDWRYSGIHALTTAGNGYLYTGSGDRTIKAWSLQEGVLSCTMTSHKSVVSTLATCNGVLYSGSWDGTIRLWSLSDHTLLTVLGENMPGTLTSVLSLVVHQNMLVAGHENGQIKIWRNDVFMKSIEEHKGAVFAIGMEGRRLFTGGWDKRVSVQELSGDDFELETRPIGSITSSSAVSCLVYWEGKLFAGCGDRTIKLYYYGE
ncbi:zinc ion binding [Euphorbia peplus]|nr:zinc ion binding [Euphorbia peplus]